MKRAIVKILMLIALVAVPFAAAAQEKSNKKERNALKEGVGYFGEENFSKALTAFDGALLQNPYSETAKFDRAASLYMLAQFPDNESVRDSLIQTAVKIYEDLGQAGSNTSVREKANYNLGNIAFDQQDYPTSIEYYKRVLRNNPGNIRARENLRVAQLKLPDQDQQQDQQDQQDQQQDQQEQQQEQQTPPPPQEQQMSQDAEQILQIMQNRENQTRENTAQPVQSNHSTDKPW